MRVGQTLTLLRKDGHRRIWQVQGIYPGATGQEDVVGLTPLDRTCPDTPGRQYELLVPLDIVQAAFEEAPDGA